MISIFNETKEQKIKKKGFGEGSMPIQKAKDAI